MHAGGAEVSSSEPVAPPIRVEMVVVKQDLEDCRPLINEESEDGPLLTEVERGEPARAAASTRTSFSSRLAASLGLEDKDADIFIVRAQVALITLAMGVAEIDDSALLALFALAHAGRAPNTCAVTMPQHCLHACTLRVRGVFVIKTIVALFITLLLQRSVTRYY